MRIEYEIGKDVRGGSDKEEGEEVYESENEGEKEWYNGGVTWERGAEENSEERGSIRGK